MSTSRFPGRNTRARTRVPQSRRIVRGAAAVVVRAVAATKATASAATRSFLTTGVLLEPRGYCTPRIGVACSTRSVGLTGRSPSEPPRTLPVGSPRASTYLNARLNLENVASGAFRGAAGGLHDFLRDVGAEVSSFDVG